MKHFRDRVAVITGAASGFGLELCRIAAGEGMKIVMADVQDEPLAAAAREIEALGAPVLAFRLDVSKAADVEALGTATVARFGVPHLLFNNAGVGAGGLVWEHTVKDWEWLVGVNLMGVAHGVRVFTPMMLKAAAEDPGFEGHIVNTASMAGLVTAPMQGAYCVTKHAAVALSETLHQDLALVTDRIHCSVLCPYFVPTGIHSSQRYRPTDLDDHVAPTRSQDIAQAAGVKAVNSGRVSAPTVAGFVFDAVRNRRFYIYSHPRIMGVVRRRMEEIIHGHNPGDPFQLRPSMGIELRAALRKPDNG
jgi:NAD(P)-dependent dehydrogenase (short-subunit alcohol dehydrogenase family)